MKISHRFSSTDTEGPFWEFGGFRYQIPFLIGFLNFCQWPQKYSSFWKIELCDLTRKIVIATNLIDMLLIALTWLNFDPKVLYWFSFQLQISEWSLICDQTWLSPLSTSLFFAGVMIGSLILGSVADRIGRKKTFVFTFLSM